MNDRLRTLVYVFPLLALLSCNSGQDETDAQGIQALQSTNGQEFDRLRAGQFKEILRIPAAEDNGKVMLQYPISVAVYGDSLLVADQRSRAVYAFRVSSGRYLGEFAERVDFAPLRCIRIDRAKQQVWVLDLGHFYSFSLDGQLQHQFRNIHSASGFDLLGDGTIVAVAEANSHKGGLAFISEHGEVLRTFSEPLDLPEDMFGPYRYGSGLVSVVAGTIWQFYGNWNLAKVFTTSGDSVRVFRITDPEMIATHTYNVGRLAENKSVARILHGMWVSNERVWVTAGIIDTKKGPDGSPSWRTVLYELDLNGETVARFDLPYRYLPEVIEKPSSAPTELILVDTLEGQLVVVGIGQASSKSQEKGGE